MMRILLIAIATLAASAAAAALIAGVASPASASTAIVTPPAPLSGFFEATTKPLPPPAGMTRPTGGTALSTPLTVEPWGPTLILPAQTLSPGELVEVWVTGSITPETFAGATADANGSVVIPMPEPFNDLSLATPGTYSVEISSNGAGLVSWTGSIG